MAITLRKKAPFFCRTQDLTGKYNCLKPLTDADIFNLCPACAETFRAALKKADAPLIPTPAIDESVNWRPSGRTGPIWPTDDEPQEAA